MNTVSSLSGGPTPNSREAYPVDPKSNSNPTFNASPLLGRMTAEGAAATIPFFAVIIARKASRRR
jgi:hypothetical protein